MRNFDNFENFSDRHIGLSQEDMHDMLNSVNAKTLNELIDQTIPQNIQLKNDMKLPEKLTEFKFLDELKKISLKNKINKSYIGMGYYPTIVPGVILRNILENPGWYTQYTPYQAEIAQGRLEALLNFQTMVCDLTAMDIANASLLDEASAAAESMIMFYNLSRASKKNSDTFFVSDKTFPQTIDVLNTRAEPLGIKLKVGKISEIKNHEEIFGILVQLPDSDGLVEDYSSLFDELKSKSIFITVAADLLSLTLITPPGEMGADAICGSTQRLGVPMGFGGPHAAYFATKDEFKRNIPGRIIGISVDSNGDRALRMALQTREQHIRREKATSNICTAQVLLAIMSSMYAVYHGPKGLKNIGERIHSLTQILDYYLKESGFEQLNKYYFDTLKFKMSKDDSERLKKYALDSDINLRYFENGEVGVSVSEVNDENDIKELTLVFLHAFNKTFDNNKYETILNKICINLPDHLTRKSMYLTHPVFNSYQSETEMLRYIRSLESKDLSLNYSMIPLGSCTMKLNATSEMIGVTWKHFSELHPFAPLDQAEGYIQIFNELEDYLAAITGFSAVSLQPNSGAQGEYSGLMVIRNYHIKNNQPQRNVILIPSSAHGTNPASAVMAGNKVVVIGCNENGDININELRNKAIQYKETLAGLMVTYPSTHGVFEEGIKEICEIIHQNGGLVYMDGANMNAQVGLTNPFEIGADVCHLNLHKTFTIPHGGGGPGVGPIAVTKQLSEFLPGHKVVSQKERSITGAVSAAPWGSANILVISYAYIRMMGANGLKDATKIAILNANYIKAKLESHFKVLYTGKNSRIAHELIFDLREFKTSAGIEVEDVAKRLMDYGFHAPTVSFPVAGTLMVEPTESESKAELDRFINAMISIRNEIKEIIDGEADKNDNVLKNAPHTAPMVLSDKWEHKYSREKACYPLPELKRNKFWPSVGRVNNAYGDRNLVCSCLPVESYKEEVFVNG